MRAIRYWFLCCSLCCLSLAACGDDDDSAAGDDAAIDGDHDDASVSGDAGTGSDAGTSVACTVDGEDIVTDDPDELSNLSVVDDELVFISSDLALTEIPKIEKVGSDGGGRTTLYTPEGDRRLHQVVARGDDVFFFEVDNGDAIMAEELYRIPLAGGAKQRVGDATFAGCRIFGVDDTHLFVWRATAQPSGSRFERVDVDSGEIETIAISTDTGTPSHVGIAGDDVYFVAGSTDPSTAIQQTVYTFEKDATEATPTALDVQTTEDPVCYLPLGGLAATPTKLACGFAGVRVFERDGTMPRTVIPGMIVPNNVLVATDAENLYVMQTGQPNGTEGQFSRIASSGGSARPIACDLGEIANRLADAFFPIQIEYEVVVGERDLFWIEKRTAAGETHWFIRSAAK